MKVEEMSNDSLSIQNFLKQIKKFTSILFYADVRFLYIFWEIYDIKRWI